LEIGSVGHAKDEIISIGKRGIAFALKRDRENLKKFKIKKVSHSRYMEMDYDIFTSNTMRPIKFGAVARRKAAKIILYYMVLEFLPGSAQRVNCVTLCNQEIVVNLVEDNRYHN